VGVVADVVEVVSACEQLQQMREVVREVEIDRGSTVYDGGQSSWGREFEDVCGDTLFVMSERRQRKMTKLKVRSSKEDEMYIDVVVRYKERKGKQE